MDSTPCLVIYFWLIKRVRFFSLLCTVCQVHYLLTHKSSSLAKGKFPLSLLRLQLVSIPNTTTQGDAPSAGAAVPQCCMAAQDIQHQVFILQELEAEYAKVCSFPTLAYDTLASLKSV